MTPVAETTVAPTLMLENLAFSYVSYPLFKAVNLEVRAGEAVLLLGEVGGGKSTLIKLIMGLEKAQGGDIRLAGTSLVAATYRAQQESRTRMGYVSQTSSLLANLSVLDNVSLPLRYHTEMTDQDAAQKAKDLLSRFGVDRYQASYPAALSPANRKLVSLARALVMDPAVVMADQLDSDLTPAVCQRVLEILKDVKKKGTAFLLVSSSARSMQGFADKVGWIKDNTLTALEPYEQARKRATLEFEY